MKKYLINLRVDDLTKNRLKDTSHNLQLNESEFIRKAIWEFEALLEHAEKWNQREEEITQLKASIRELKRQLQAYDDDVHLNKLFSAHKGQIIDGKCINKRTDLLSVLAKNITIDVLEAEEQKPLTSKLTPVVLQAQPTAKFIEEKSEPLTLRDFMVWMKHHWLLALTLLGTGIAYIIWRWWSSSSKKADKSAYSLANWSNTSLLS